MRILTFILNIFLNDVFFYLIRAVLILIDAALFLWILNSWLGIAYHWLVVIALAVIAAFWGLYLFVTRKRSGAVSGSSGSQLGRICEFFRNLRKAKQDEAAQAHSSENAGADAAAGGTDWSNPDSVISEDGPSSAADDAASSCGDDTASSYGDDTASSYGDDAASSYGDDTASSYADNTASSYSEDTASYGSPDYRGSSGAGALPPDIPERVPVGMGSKLTQIIILFGLFCCFSYEIFKDAPTSFIGMIVDFFKPEIVVKTESEIMGIKTIEKLYTGFVSIDKEDMHYGEGLLSGRYLDGLCVKKYRIHYGYRDIGKYLDDEKVMEAVCSGNIAALPKPELLAVNSQSQEQTGNYDVSGDCYRWDASPERRAGMLLADMNRYQIYNVRDSQAQLRTFLQPACETIFARKAEEAAAAAALQEVSPDGQKE